MGDRRMRFLTYAPGLYCACLEKSGGVGLCRSMHRYCGILAPKTDVYGGGEAVMSCELLLAATCMSRPLSLNYGAWREGSDLRLFGVFFFLSSHFSIPPCFKLASEQLFYDGGCLKSGLFAQGLKARTSMGLVVTAFPIALI